MTTQTTLIDLFIAGGKACARAFGRLMDLIAAMLRLTWRKWYIVIPAFCIVAALQWYNSRLEHRTHQVDGIVLLNGPSIDHFREAYKALGVASPLVEGRTAMDKLGLSADVTKRLSKFTTYEVIDMLADGYPDIVDYRNKVQRNDTNIVRMQDRMAIRFYLKNDVQYLPQIEQALLAYFNNDPDMRAAYDVYVRDLKREAQFHHDQVEKLDSLTSVFYFHYAPATEQMQLNNRNMLIGDRRIRLFIEDIETEMEHTRRVDQRLARATAPVVLEHELIATTSIQYHPIIRLCIAVMIGWIMGCLIAYLVEQRQRLIAWFRA